MNRYKKITQQEFKELIEEIYKMGQDSKTVDISNFIKVIENKILSINDSKVVKNFIYQNGVK